MGKKNPVAFVLRTPLYRPRKTKVAKGKGAYTRKTRHRSGRTDGVFFCVHSRPRGLFFCFSVRPWQRFSAFQRNEVYFLFQLWRDHPIIKDVIGSYRP